MGTSHFEMDDVESKSEPEAKESRLGSISAILTSDNINIERQSTEYPIMPENMKIPVVESRFGSISAVTSTDKLRIERQPTEYPIIPLGPGNPIRESRLGSISAVPSSESLKVKRQPTEYPINVIKSAIDRFSLRKSRSVFNFKPSQASINSQLQESDLNQHCGHRHSDSSQNSENRNLGRPSVLSAVVFEPPIKRFSDEYRNLGRDSVISAAVFEEKPSDHSQSKKSRNLGRDSVLSAAVFEKNPWAESAVDRNMGSTSVISARIFDTNVAAFMAADRNLDRNFSVPSIVPVQNSPDFLDALKKTPSVKSNDSPMIEDDNEDYEIFYESLPSLPEIDERTHIPSIYRSIPFSNQCTSDLSQKMPENLKSASNESIESQAYLPPTIGSISNFHQFVPVNRIADMISTKPSAESRAYLPFSESLQALSVRSTPERDTKVNFKSFDHPDFPHIYYHKSASDTKFPPKLGETSSIMIGVRAPPTSLIFGKDSYDMFHFVDSLKKFTILEKNKTAANQFVDNILSNLDEECQKLNQLVTKVHDICSDFAIKKLMDENHDNEPEF